MKRVLVLLLLLLVAAGLFADDALVLPKGVHRVKATGQLADVTEWQMTWQLRPRIRRPICGPRRQTQNPQSPNSPPTITSCRHPDERRTPSSLAPVTITATTF